MPDWAALQHNLGVTWSDLSLLEQAFVHRSYVNENPDFTRPSNERLEYLGDAVLGLVVAADLFRLAPTLDEGTLTKLRSALIANDNLVRLARTLHLGEYLFLGQGEERNRGRQRARNLVCCFEAMIGAAFLDQGYEAAVGLVRRLLGDQVQGVLEEGPTSDYKSMLQEILQARGKGTPAYHLLQATGPDHDKVFMVEVTVGNELLATGSGTSKQAAEKEAARHALRNVSGS